MTYLFVKPRELHGGNVPDKFDDGPGDVRRQGVVGRQQRQEIWDNTDLARPAICARLVIRWSSPRTRSRSERSSSSERTSRTTSLEMGCDTVTVVPRRTAPPSSFPTRKALVLSIGCCVAMARLPFPG